MQPGSQNLPATATPRRSTYKVRRLLARNRISRGRRLPGRLYDEIRIKKPRIHLSASGRMAGKNKAKKKSSVEKTPRMEPPATKQRSITPDKLAQLTHLTIDEIRRLSVRGYFPKAGEDGYHLLAGLTGIFNFYSELRGASGLPAYDSLDQCASRTSIPLPILKQ